jgi:hypothetical protein
MRSLVLFGVALVALTSLASGPTFAGRFSGILQSHVRPVGGRDGCVPPQVGQMVCTAWGPAAAGKMFGPCIDYSYECQTPGHIN